MMQAIARGSLQRAPPVNIMFKYSAKGPQDQIKGGMRVGVVVVLLLMACVARPTSLPGLKGPFTLAFTVVTKDGRSVSSFEKDLASYRDSLEPEVTSHRISQGYLDQLLQRKHEEYLALASGVRERLVISSDGATLLVATYGSEATDVAPERLSLLAADNYFVLTPGTEAGKTNMRVTSPAVFPLGQSVPMLGCQLPNVPDDIKVAADVAWKSGQPIPASIRIGRTDGPGDPLYVNGAVSVSRFTAKGEPIVSDISVGPIDLPSIRWSVGERAESAVGPLPKSVTQTYYTTGKKSAERVITYELTSAKSSSLPADQYLPEHYLKSDDLISYESSGGITNKFSFQFHQGAGSLRSQIKAQSSLVAPISQRAKRDEVPKGSYLGIFGILAAVVILLIVVALSWFRHKKGPARDA